MTDRLSLRGWAYVNHLSEQDTQYDDGTYRSFDLVAGSFREQIRSTVKGMSVQRRYDLGSAGAVNFLLLAEQDHWDGSGSLTLGPGSSSPVNEFHSFNIYSTAVEFELSPVPGLGLVAGYGHHWQARGALDEDGYSALAAAYCDVFWDTRVKASFSRNIRFPTLRTRRTDGQRRDGSDPSVHRAATAALQECGWKYGGAVERNGFRSAVPRA